MTISYGSEALDSPTEFVLTIKYDSSDSSDPQASMSFEDITATETRAHKLMDDPTFPEGHGDDYKSVIKPQAAQKKAKAEATAVVTSERVERVVKLIAEALKH